MRLRELQFMHTYNIYERYDKNIFSLVSAIDIYFLIEFTLEWTATHSFQTISHFEFHVLTMMATRSSAHRPLIIPIYLSCQYIAIASLLRSHISLSRFAWTNLYRLIKNETRQVQVDVQSRRYVQGQRLANLAIDMIDTSLLKLINDDEAYL